MMKQENPKVESSSAHKLWKAIALLALSGLLLSSLSYYSIPDKEDQNFKQQFNKAYRVYALELPKKLNFLSEEVPVHRSDVYESLDREMLVNTYWQSQTLLFFKRAKKWLPQIETLLEKEVIPNDFKYLALIESGLLDIVSPSGAVGFWQIMKATGKEYGLRIDSEVDERYDLEKATSTAAKYLKEGYGKYGSWTLAAASYNMGMNGMDRTLVKQGVDNYYDLYLNPETARYVYRMIAVKLIMESPSDFGFQFRDKDLYSTVPVSVLNVDSSISNLSTFAQEQGTTYKQLRLLNPWLRSNHVSPTSGGVLAIKIPKKDLKN